MPDSRHSKPSRGASATVAMRMLGASRESALVAPSAREASKENKVSRSAFLYSRVDFSSLRLATSEVCLASRRLESVDVAPSEGARTQFGGSGSG